MDSSLPQFCASVTDEAERGNLDFALARIIDLVVQVILHRSSLARVLSSPELDKLCQLVGRLAREQSGPGPQREEHREDHAVYLVTELAKSGGHTRVLSDIIAAEKSSRHTILVSDIYETTKIGDLSGLFSQPQVTISVAPRGNFLCRLRWMQHQLAHSCPSRTYILPHHFDACTMAAAQPDLVGKLVYIHNCDHALALGVHLPHARHIDLHAKGFYHCREQEGVLTNVLWPLVAPDQGHRVDAPFLRRGHLTTCTSGGFEKFEPRHGIEQVPYLYHYDNVIPQLLQASRGTHIHIGELSDAMVNKIRGALAELAIPEDRFVYIPYVPSLWTAFLDQHVDVYVGSFPLGGGRATVEAMGAGLPLIVHSNYWSIFFSDLDVYDGAMLWRAPAELAGLVSQLDRAQLAEHAHASRAQYLSHHRPEFLAGAIALEEMGYELPPPPRPAHIPNRLQAYLDERQAIWTQSREKVFVTDEEMMAAKERAAIREIVEREVRDALERKWPIHEDLWRPEVERVRMATIRDMKIPARAKKAFRKLARFAS